MGWSWSYSLKYGYGGYYGGYGYPYCAGMYASPYYARPVVVQAQPQVIHVQTPQPQVIVQQPPQQVVQSQPAQTQSAPRPAEVPRDIEPMPEPARPDYSYSQPMPSASRVEGPIGFDVKQLYEESAPYPDYEEDAEGTSNPEEPPYPLRDIKAKEVSRVSRANMPVPRKVKPQSRSSTNSLPYPTAPSPMNENVRSARPPRETIQPPYPVTANTNVDTVQKTNANAQNQTANVAPKKSDAVVSAANALGCTE